MLEALDPGVPDAPAIERTVAWLEPMDYLKRRIDEAAKVVPLEQLAISPQCGFASVADGGNLLSEDDQRRKLELLADVSRMYWGFEI